MCRSKQINTVDQRLNEESDERFRTVEEEISETESFYLMGVESCEGDDEPPWREDVVIIGQSIQFKLDSGADVTVINRHTWVLLEKPKLRTTTQTEGGRWISKSARIL